MTSHTIGSEAMADNLNELDFPSILASTVHDMKNSIGFLISSLDDLLSELPDTAAQQPAAHQLRYHAKHLNGNLVQLLTLYKLEKQQYLINIEQHDVGEFLHEQLIDYHEWLTSSRITLTLDCPDDLLWFFDASLIASVINNVVNNVYKYTRSSIHISAAMENDWLCLTISDDGPGYPDELLGKRFSSPSGIDVQSGSTGLGLYFAAVVAHNHVNQQRHGYIQLDNADSQGGRFRLYLP